METKNNAAATPLTNKEFFRTVAVLVVPMALQNLINAAVQAADVFMLGMVDENVLSAASLAGQVQFVMMLFFFGLGSGALVLAAQYWGKGDKRTIEKVMSIALRLSMAVAFLFFLLAELIPGQLMRVFTSDPVLIEYGVEYLRLVAPSYLFTGFTSLYLMIIRSVEQVVVSTVVYFISLVVNISANAILIFGLLGFPALGIAGAAIGTTIARFVELVITLVYALRNPVIRLRAKDFVKWHPRLTSDFTKYAIPTMINELLWGIAMSANTMIIGRLGAQAVAAYSVVQNIRQLALVVCFGIAGAAGILVGKALGADNPALAEDYARRMVRLTLVAGVCSTAVIWLIRPLVFAAMNLSPLAQHYLGIMMTIMSFYVIAQSYASTMITGIFRGGGDIKFGLYIDVVTMWCCSILWAALGAFVFHWPTEVVIVIILCDEFLKIPIVWWRYRKKLWLRNVTR